MLVPGLDSKAQDDQRFLPDLTLAGLECGPKGGGGGDEHRPLDLTQLRGAGRTTGPHPPPGLSPIRCFICLIQPHICDK